MRTLPKMTSEEITLPVGTECSCACQAEAEAFFATKQKKNDYIRLMVLTTKENKNYFCWCGFSKEAQLKWAHPLFNEDSAPQTLPSAGRPFEEGEYLKYGNDFYLITIDKMLGIMVKQIAIFSTALDAGAAWHMMTMTPQGTGDDEPDYYLVKITEVSNPNVPICICWCILPPKGKNKLIPVFREDRVAFNAIPFNRLNWEFLHEGDTFVHDDTIYQICKDEIDDYYITPSPLQICKRNI